MVRNKLKDIKTLIVRLALVAGIIAVIVLAYRAFTGTSDSDGFELDNTPLHIEQIRDIIELNTIRFRDEVVVDSVEYYRNIAQQVAGNLQKLTDLDQLEHGVTASNVKRRLTMVVKGELLYGVDLKTKEFTIIPRGEQWIITLPAPALLSVNLTPGNTEVFVENGEWTDFERQVLQRKARGKMVASGEWLRLKEKAKEPLERLLRQLIRTDKQVVIKYYE